MKSESHMEIWEQILNREYKISRGPESRRKKVCKEMHISMARI